MARYLTKLISKIRQRGLRTILSLGVKVRSVLELFIPRTIWGDRIGLRPVKSSLSKVEAEQVYGWSRDTEVLRWSGGTPTNLTLDEFYNQLRHERWRPSENERVFYIVTRAGELIGRVGLFTIDWDKGEGELGILIDKRYWNKRYGRDAVKLFLQYVWSATPLQRVYLNTATDNIRAQRSFSACGFRTVGIGRRYIPATGEYVTEGIQMEILRKDLHTKPTEEGLSQTAKENAWARFFRNTAVLFSPHPLCVKWYDQWHPLLDEALASLPEMPSCPHELFRLLIQNPTVVRKRIGLVTEQGTPVAVVGLRQRGRHSWEPVTQWIIPGAIFPAKPGYLIPALEAVGSEVWVAWWRMGEPPSPSRFIRYIESTPTYRMDLTGDYELYWRRTSHHKTVVQNRNRCRKFTFAVNLPGSAEWTINNWEAKWRTNPAVADPSLSDRIVAAKYLESQGRYFTLSLLDQGVPIGGATLMAHGKDLVAGVIHRDPKYDWYGVGVRLVDLSFSFAVESGFERLDLGGGHEYKKYWAPQEGERWWFNICPEPLFRAKQVANWIRGLRGKVSDRTSGQIQL